nr:unnamed protein product [Digitaria exilis]
MVVVDVIEFFVLDGVELHSDVVVAAAHGRSRVVAVELDQAQKSMPGAMTKAMPSLLASE